MHRFFKQQLDKHLMNTVELKRELCPTLHVVWESFQLFDYPFKGCFNLQYLDILLKQLKPVWVYKFVDKYLDTAERLYIN